MNRTILVAFAVAAAGYLGICGAMFVFQRSLLYFPRPRSVTMPESTLHLPVEGADLVVSVRPHVGSKAILYFGGNAEDVSSSLAEFTALFPGHALYLLHYRGYGGSTGSPTEAANHRDAAALFDRVRAEHTEVAVIGRSLGSGVAVRLASQRPVSRLVLVTPYDSLEEIAAGAYPFVPVRWLLLDRYDSGAYARDIRIPAVLIAAEHDEVIPRASTEKLFGRFAPGVASMTVLPGVGHNDLDRNGEYQAALAAAVRSTP